MRYYVSICRVSKSWRDFSGSDRVWGVLLDRDFKGGISSSTLNAALQHGKTTKAAYSLLAKKNSCLRCKLIFQDGDNTASSCNFHPGLLFSGGQLNGAALRFTCCSRRAHHGPTDSRDRNGCKTCYHVSEKSLWTPEGAIGAALRTNSAKDATPTVSSSSSRYWVTNNGSPACVQLSSSPQRAVEWHPNQRPGLLELPTRLLLPV